MHTKILDNDAFVKKHLERLVKKYPRQRIVICRGKIFTGEDAVQKARKEFPGVTPMSFPVPAHEEFVHIL